MNFFSTLKVALLVAYFVKCNFVDSYKGVDENNLSLWIQFFENEVINGENFSKCLLQMNINAAPTKTSMMFFRAVNQISKR